MIVPADPSLSTTKRAIFGPTARFHHVGLGVPSIERADPDAQRVVNRSQGVVMAFVNVSGITVELLEPLHDKSPVARSAAGGPSLLHLCFEVDDLGDAMECGRSAGFHRISAPVAVPEWEGRRIVWVFSQALGLVELAERPRIT